MAAGSFPRGWALGRVHAISQFMGSISLETLPLFRDAMASFLHGCMQRKDLDGARCVHSAIFECGYEWSNNLGCHLINIYGSSNCLSDADYIFNSLQERSTTSWTLIISTHANNGNPERAILLYGQMRCTTIKPNCYTFISALKSCAHVGALAEEHNEDAVQVLQVMNQNGVEPNKVTFLYQLKLSSSSKSIEQGKRIHHQVCARGLESDLFLENTLINMYAKCNKLNDASYIFHKLSIQNLVSWSAMIHGYAENGHGEYALEMFLQMRKKGIRPDEVTYVSVLKACGAIRALEHGRLIHIDALKCNIVSNVFVGSVLIVMYLKCGSIPDARRVFDRLSIRNVVSWSSIIEGYVEQGQSEEALKLFKDMHKARVEPNAITFISSIKACAGIGATDQGKLIHGNIIEQGLESELLIANTLVDIYAKGGCFEEAVRVFDTAPIHCLESWSALIMGFANYGHLRLASHYFQAMCESGICPDLVAFLGLLYACSHTGSFKEFYFHFKFMTDGQSILPTQEHFVCMVDMFGRAGLLDGADAIVCKMPFLPDSVTWKALLSSCVQHNDLGVGRHAFESLLDYGCKASAGEDSPMQLLVDIWVHQPF
ncbi:hypothetical protein KP509_23G012500 [Ceratopteris richardii]|uniref:Pentatricopeptide repeat-containing protein n=1 Tax=Ceratopteris richardii TaxID=49495 RepID=A0A8T2S043_CERRI|nr:hypothetical protein KP509_23G012500 [Ceratopteris richardii]